MYQLAFWNGVDLRYRHVDNPKVRLRIAGIIIGQDRAATPYMNKHRHNDVINVSEAWNSMQAFWGQTSRHADFPPAAYDVVVTMTDYDMITINNDRSTSRILGRAAKRTLCVGPSYYALAVVRDKGGFDGILAATHELGHIMSLDHDTKSGDECDVSFGFIMAPSNVVTLRNLEWSPCSLRSLSHFFRETEVKCADKPSEFHTPGPSVSRFLPGVLLDAHKQCQTRGYSFACDPNPKMCKRMKCYHTGWKAFKEGWWCQKTSAAAEGTACAPGHKCVDGVCQCLTEDCVFEKKRKIV